MAEIEPYALTIALEVLKIIGGVLVPLLTIGITIYAKKLEDKMKRKAVEDEIGRLVQAGEKVKFFSAMNEDSKVETVLETIRPYVMENGINISDTELIIMIQQIMSAPERLKMTGLRLGLVNLYTEDKIIKGENHGKVIEK